MLLQICLFYNKEKILRRWDESFFLFSLVHDAAVAVKKSSVSMKALNFFYVSLYLLFSLSDFFHFFAYHAKASKDEEKESQTS